MRVYPIQTGERLVRAARNSIELYLTTPRFDRKLIEKHIEDVNERHGVFVTIEHYPTRTLRGCVGFPRPHGVLKETLIEAAIAAAAGDPRFVPVSHMEFEDMTVGVNVLSHPQLIKAKTEQGIKKEIKLGRDGLMMEYGYHSGLLLPNAPLEQNLTKEHFLDNLCVKAGMQTHMWKHNGTKLYKFTSQVFRELSPRGPIEEILLD